jgi:hypothetical protein
MKLVLISIVLCGAVLIPRSACPQQGRGAVRGVVRAATGDRIAYAVVALEPGFPRRFADDSGSFGFTRVAPGTYHLLARQVGYKPLDTTVVVLPDSTLVVPLALEHLVVELTEINVTGELARAGRPERCTQPGPPNPARAPDLAAIFGQLKQNAERYWMMADSFPVLYRTVRRLGMMGYLTAVDTLELRTDTRWHYVPGQLISEVEGPRRERELQVNLPTLPDLADSAFVANHCFRLVGLDTLARETYVRIDFRPDERLTEPDADGSAYLDPDTYLVRHVAIRLTRPDRALVGLVSFSARASYREIAPMIVIVDSITADQAAYQGSQLIERREEQRLLNTLFLRRLPRGQVVTP